MRTTLQYRQEFAILLGQLADSRYLGLRELAKQAYVNPSLLSDIKSGRKCCGPDIAMQLAGAMLLTGQEREGFLIIAAGTRTHDRLMKLSRGLDPHLVNHLPLALSAIGVHPASVDACTRTGNTLELTLDDQSTVTCSTTVVHQQEGSHTA